MVATENAPTIEDFLSPGGLAALLGVPVSTIYRWNYEGTSPPLIRLGKHVRYRREDVEAWLDERTESRP